MATDLINAALWGCIEARGDIRTLCRIVSKRKTVDRLLCFTRPPPKGHTKVRLSFDRKILKKFERGRTSGENHPYWGGGHRQFWRIVLHRKERNRFDMSGRKRIFVANAISVFKTLWEGGMPRVATASLFYPLNHIQNLSRQKHAKNNKRKTPNDLPTAT